jgi:hypothetical protein
VSGRRCVSARSYRLDPDAVDAVRQLAGRLLEESPEFVEFVKTLN